MSVMLELISKGIPATDRFAVAQLIQPVAAGGGGGVCGPQQRLG